MMNVASSPDFRRRAAARGARALAALSLAAAGLAGAPAQAEGSIYYVCPGNVFTNTITSKEAEAKGCKAKEAQQPTTIPAPPRRAAPAAAAAPASSRIDAKEQQARDSDARRILQDELAKAQAQLETLNKEYNGGNPERQGDEKNYAKYQQRVADLKASIDRTQADIAAIQRELAKTAQ
jgi:chromosome segregation ATPase